MRVLLINQYFPPDTAPTGVSLHDLAHALVSRGHDVTVVCSRRGYNSDDMYAEEEFIGGVQARRLATSCCGRR